MSGSSLGPEKQTGKDQKKQFKRSKLTVSDNPRTLHVCTKRDKEKEPKTKRIENVVSGSMFPNRKLVIYASVRF